MIGTSIGSAFFDNNGNAFTIARSPFPVWVIPFFPATTTVVIIPAIEMAMALTIHKFFFPQVVNFTNPARTLSLMISLTFAYLLLILVLTSFRSLLRLLVIPQDP